MNMIVHIKHAHFSNFSQQPGIAGTLTGVDLGEALKGLDTLSAGPPSTTSATIPEIGQPWPEQGGIRAAYMPSEGDKPGYSIIVPTDAAAYREELKWGPYDNEVKGLSERDGLANTKILADGKHPAAQFCADLKIGDHSDFYLMANREASLLRAVAPHLFTPGYHWTSTQYSANLAFVQDVSDGDQDGSGKGSTWRVRAVRRFIH